MNTQEDILKKEEARMKAHYKIVPRTTPEQSTMSEFFITLAGLPAAPGNLVRFW